MARKTPVTACERNANIVADPSVYAQLIPFGTLRKSIQQTPGDSDVRSSIQSTTVRPASSGGKAPTLWGSPGFFGLGSSAFGSGGAGRRGMRQLVGIWEVENR